MLCIVYNQEDLLHEPYSLLIKKELRYDDLTAGHFVSHCLKHLCLNALFFISSNEQTAQFTVMGRHSLRASENSLIILPGDVHGRGEIFHMLRLTTNEAAILRLGAERADGARPHPRLSAEQPRQAII